MHGRLALGCVIAVLPFVACSAVSLRAVVASNGSLSRTEHIVDRAPLPPGSSVSQGSSLVGLLGNGSHCDIEVRRILITPRSAEAVRAHYEASRVELQLRALRDDRPVDLAVHELGREAR